MVTDSGNVLMAIAKYGKGTVFAMTDQWLYNEYRDGLKLPPEYQNDQGGKELAHWLLLEAHSTPRVALARDGQNEMLLSIPERSRVVERRQREEPKIFS